MTDMKVFNVQPYQFRIAHDISLENLYSPDETVEFDLQSSLNSLHNGKTPPIVQVANGVTSPNHNDPCHDNNLRNSACVKPSFGSGTRPKDLHIINRHVVARDCHGRPEHIGLRTNGYAPDAVHQHSQRQDEDHWLRADHGKRTLSQTSPEEELHVAPGTRGQSHSNGPKARVSRVAKETENSVFSPGRKQPESDALSCPATSSAGQCGASREEANCSNGNSEQPGGDGNERATTHAEESQGDDELTGKPKKSSTKRRRRPRKLPQIPTDAPRKSVAALIRVHSLADELCDVDPNFCQTDPMGSRSISGYESGSASSYSQDSGSLCNDCPSIEGLADLGSPDQIDCTPLQEHAAHHLHVMSTSTARDSGFEDHLEGEGRGGPVSGDSAGNMDSLAVEMRRSQTLELDNNEKAKVSDADYSLRSRIKPGNVEPSAGQGRCFGRSHSGPDDVIVNGKGAVSTDVKGNISSGISRSRDRFSCHEIGYSRPDVRQKLSATGGGGSPENSPRSKGMSLQNLNTFADITRPKTDPEPEMKTPTARTPNFSEHSEFIDDCPKSDAPRCLGDDIKVAFDATASAQRTALAADNAFLQEGSSQEESKSPKKSSKWKLKFKEPNGKSAATGGRAPKRSSGSNSYHGDLHTMEATHRGCHKFIPRHDDEIFVEIGDPLMVEDEADDLWCEGINLRTGQKGIFPAAYATDLALYDGDEGDVCRPARFILRFLGSVEVHQHRGNDVICQAIHKVAVTRRMTLNADAPPLYCLEINEYGIKMTDKSKLQKVKKAGPESPKKSIRQRLMKMLTKSADDQDNHNHFFSLKNVSFCGFHPRNEKYFAFITKHPLEMRFACHVFLGEDSTKPIAEAIGEAFKRFYQEYMAFVHPTEDIYLE